MARKKKRSRRYYLVAVWSGEDVRLSDQIEGKVCVSGSPDPRVFTRKRAEEILAKIQCTSLHPHWGGYAIREEKHEDQHQ